MAIQTQFNVEFRKDGTIYDENEVSTLLGGLGEVSNLIVISHGWNNDKAEANTLYNAFLESVDEIADADIVDGANARRLGVVRLFWPSKKFAERDLIPGGGVSLERAETESRESLIQLLEELKNDPVLLGGRNVDEVRRVHLNRAQALVPELHGSQNARCEFVQSLRAILNPDEKHPEDGSSEFFTKEPESLFVGLSQSVKFTQAPGRGGAAGTAPGGASNLISDVAEGVIAAARRIANFATYYQMKTRAGIVGRTGVALLLGRVREQRPKLPLNLVGHSFGGRLIVAAASTLKPSSDLVTIMLLQAAFSHNGLAEKFDKINDGSFRTLLSEKRISGPLLITHTKNDKAVGIAYPLASRISDDVASALGDENDPYGGMGRNGAQYTPEAEPGILGDTDKEYNFKPNQVVNLRADEFIKNHGEVTGHQVAYAFWHGVVAGS